MARYTKKWLWLLFVIPGLFVLWLGFTRKSNAPAPPPAQPAANDAASGIAKPPQPEYEPITEASLRGLEGGTEYLLSGKVTSDTMEPLAGATVSVYATAPRWTPPSFEQPPPIDSQTTDAAGDYQIRLNAPADLWVVARKDGYAQTEIYVPVRDPKTAVKDIRIPPAQSTVIGIVSDKADHPIANALVIANPYPSETVADSPAYSPIGRVTEATGQYSIEGLPEGDVKLYVFARGYLMDEGLGVLRASQPQQVNFNLASATAASFVVKNSRGEAIPYPTAVAIGLFKLAGGDDRGVIEFGIKPGSGQSECTVMAYGYKPNTVTLEPKAIPPVVTLEDKPVLNGRVLADSGEAIEGALVSVYGTGGLQGKFDGAVRTDKTGRFSLPMSYPPVREVRASKTGYFDQRLTIAPGKAAPPALDIRMKRVESGVFGRVIDYRGVPVRRFVVHIRNAAGARGAEFQRVFISDRGAFAVTDIAPGTYTLLFQSVQSATTDDVQLVRMDEVEFRKGFLYGEMIAQFPKPMYKK